MQAVSHQTTNRSTHAGRGLTHDCLAQNIALAPALFRNRPALAPELLRDTLHVELPDYTEVRIDSADLTDIQPAEYCPAGADGPNP